MSKSIFVSHAATDGAIADKVVDLLNTAMGIDVQEHVFCTSLEGLKVPPGKDFKEFIKDQIQEPKIVLMLISQNYLASHFCLAEVGASWALSHRAIPMLIPPVKYADMKAVLANVQALKIDNPSDWNEALAVFKEELGIDPKTNRWERKRNEHLEAIKALILKQELTPVVPIQKLQEAEAKLKEANEEIAELESTNQQLRKLLDVVKKAKDAGEVAALELAQLPAAEAFEALVSDAADELRGFNQEVREVIYYHFRGEPAPMPRTGFANTDDRWDDIRRAVEDEYLCEDGTGGIQLNSDDPTISNALTALSNLKNFIEKTPVLAKPYAEEHGYQLSFSSRRFWEENLHL